MERSEVKLWIALSVVATLPYLNAVGAGFTYDDRGFILGNAVVQSARFPLAAAFATPYEPGFLYRPVTALSYWLNLCFGASAFGFHGVNVLLHTVVTLLVFALGRTLLPRAGALLAAALFAVHPIHTEAVTSIVGRAEELAALGVLGALLCAHRARTGNSPARWLALGAALFAFALFSKESAFVLLPILLIVSAAWDGTGFAAALRRTIAGPAGIVFGGTALTYLALRVWLFGGLTLPAAPEWLDNPLAHAGAAVRMATAAVVLGDYARLLLLPLRLSADYSYDQVPLVVTALDPRLMAACLLGLCSGVAVWRMRRRIPATVTGTLFSLAALGVTANVLFPIGTIQAERLLYLPSVGFVFVAGGVAARAWAQRPRQTAALCCVLLAALALRTWTRNQDWHSDLTLFRATVATSPYSAKAHHNLGVALDDVGEYTEASLAFRRALELHPEYEEAAFGIGRMYERRGNLAGALHWYNEAVRINPRFDKAQLNRGVIHYNRRHFAAAENAFRAGLSASPEDPRLLTGLGLSRLARGDTADAAQLLGRAAEIDGGNEETQRALRLALGARDVTAKDSL